MSLEPLDPQPLCLNKGREAYNMDALLTVTLERDNLEIKVRFNPWIKCTDTRLVVCNEDLFLRVR